MLWHNPRLEPRPPVFGQNFDDWWSGGWDEVFPTCDVSTYQGETYPYLGELWSLPWSWETTPCGSGVAVHLSRTTVIATARMERWITLEGETSKKGAGLFSIVVKENRTGTDRRGVVRVSNYSIVVVQKKGPR